MIKILSIVALCVYFLAYLIREKGHAFFPIGGDFGSIGTIINIILTILSLLFGSLSPVSYESYMEGSYCDRYPDKFNAYSSFSTIYCKSNSSSNRINEEFVILNNKTNEVKRVLRENNKQIPPNRRLDYDIIGEAISLQVTKNPYRPEEWTIVHQLSKDPPKAPTPISIMQKAKEDGEGVNEEAVKKMLQRYNGLLYGDPVHLPNAFSSNVLGHGHLLESISRMDIKKQLVLETNSVAVGDIVFAIEKIKQDREFLNQIEGMNNVIVLLKNILRYTVMNGIIETKILQELALLNMIQGNILNDKAEQEKMHIAVPLKRN